MIADLLLIFQVVVTLLLIFVVLLQKTGNDTVSGLSAAGPSVLSGRSSSKLLKKTTVILAIAFMANSLFLARFMLIDSKSASSIASGIEAESITNSSKRPEPSVPHID